MQVDVSPGDQVIAILNSFPLLNGVMCSRLGEVKTTFEECDLVLQPGAVDGSVMTDPIKCDRWHAWVNRLPPAPDELHVIGMIDVPNPGVDVSLVERVPQGVNPDDLLVELILEQKPGIWPQRVVTKQVAYERVVFGQAFKKVIVLVKNSEQISIPVIVVS
jgi:hypothetical protein